MMASDAHADLFAASSEGPPPGTIDGPPGWQEGFAAGLRCWCGPAIGWRPFGEMLRDGNWGLIVHQRGRLSVGLIFDLGPHRFPRPRKVEPSDA